MASQKIPARNVESSPPRLLGASAGRCVRRAGRELELLTTHLVNNSVRTKLPGVIKFPSDSQVDGTVPRGNDPVEREAIKREVYVAISWAFDRLKTEMPESFSVPGPIKLDPLSIQSVINKYLNRFPEPAYVIGAYFEKYAPQSKVLEKHRSEAMALVNRLADLIREEPALASEIKKNIRFQKVFETVASSNEPTALPPKAPELWEKRKTASGETSLGFLRRVYTRWLPTPLTISTIGGLDHGLYQSLKRWAGRNTPPKDLEDFFRGTRKRQTAEEVEAELKRFNIQKPEDAFTRFPTDKRKANRLYMAALRRL